MEDDLSSLDGHKYFKRAIKLIENHPERDKLLSIHCAIIVRGGSIISIGINRAKRNKLADKYFNYENRTIHAECEAVRLAYTKTDSIKGCKMYVARIYKKNKKLAMSKPCVNCQSMISDYGIKKVYYTTSVGIKQINVSQF